MAKKDDKTNSGNRVVDESGNVIEFGDEKAPKFPFLLRRIAEILIISVLSSLPFAILYALGFSNSESWAFRFMGASLAIFTIANIYFFRVFYYSMGNRRIYYNVNVTAYLIFAAINVLFLVFIGDKTLPSAYSFMFMPMKLANLFLNRIYITGNHAEEFQLISAVLTHLMMFVIIFLAPAEMYTFDKPKAPRNR